LAPAQNDIGLLAALLDVDVSFLKLADIGLHGNGHMMMMEKNSDAIAQVIVDWLDKVVPAGR
jgi:hypothetical protein